MILLNNPHVRLFLGATLTSFASVFVALVDVSPTISGFYRGVFACIALSLFLLLTRKRLEMSRAAWIAVAISGVFFALDLWFWHRSIIFVGPGLATLLASMQVFFMIGAGILFLNQKPSSRQVVAIPLAVVGLVMIVGLNWNELPADYQTGVVLGVLTAICFAGYMMFMRQALTHTSHSLPVREVAVMSMFLAIFLGAAALVEGESFVIPTLADAGWLAANGLLAHSLGLLLVASSLTKVTTTQVGIALLLQPTLSILWDVLFFARSVTVIEASGAVIVLLAIFLGSTRRRAKQTEHTGQ